MVDAEIEELNIIFTQYCEELELGACVIFKLLLTEVNSKKRNINNDFTENKLQQKFNT